MKADNFNNKEGYSQETKVEPEKNARVRSESPTLSEERNSGKEYEKRMLERILMRDNLNQAYKRVKANKGSHGIDGMKVDELHAYLKEHGNSIRQSILDGTYRPKPVRRVEIPKSDGGIRLLGIPTVIDRVIQQAIAQKLSPVYEKQFTDSSYGFRPNRSARQAVMKSKEYIEAGYEWVVDIDLAKYFDTVNHDKLMRILSQTIKDGRVLSLIRKYLQSGVMINGVVKETEEGTPQGGNLSPLLSNVMLHELDRELEKRGLKYCRYADDCNIYVRSKKAAERVKASITKFIEQKLKLKVNEEKSAVDKPTRINFLGFSFYYKKGGVGIRVHAKSVKKFKAKLKRLTGRSNALSMNLRTVRLKWLITGWVNYFSIADMRGLSTSLDRWLRRSIRMCFWKQWKKIKTKHDNLVRFGTDNSKAWEYANTRKSYWRTANSPILSTSLSIERLKKCGLPSLADMYSFVH